MRDLSSDRRGQGSSRTRLAIGACLMLLLSAVALTGNAAWPTTEFEVFEGEPNLPGKSVLERIAKDYADTLEFKTEASVRLTPKLKREMEAMLHDTAVLLERWGFPAPLYDPPIARDDGSKAWRVYYYDFPEGRDDLARYSSDCGDGRDRIAVNARKFTNSGKMTPKSYGDLAHELFHAVQAALPVRRVNCANPPGGWIIEGQAEAFGHDMARKLRKLEHPGQATRWGWREYNRPLPEPGTTSETRPTAYQSSSFWRYLAERYHLQQLGRVLDQSLPGPDLPADYDTDYRYLVTMMQRPINRAGWKGELAWADIGIRTAFKSSTAEKVKASDPTVKAKIKTKGLKQFFTEFLAVYADYAGHRVKVTGSRANAIRKWIGGSFTPVKDGVPAGCPKVSIDAQSNTDVRTRLALSANAASCLEIVTGAMPGPKPWIIQSTAGSPALTRQLGMALAGGQQLHLAALIDAGTEESPPASWGFVFKPNQTYWLIVTNMAEQMSRTRAQGIGLRITLNVHDTSTTPTAPPMRSRSRGKPGPVAPGPRGASAELARTLDATKPGPYGPGAVSWSPKEGGPCNRGEWRFYCEGGAVIALGLSPGRDAAISVMAGDATGGLLTQALSASMFDFMAADAWIEEVSQLPGAAVTLRVPGVDYGFTGTVSDAEITVSAGDQNRDHISIPPRPLNRWSPCNYGNPNGTVTIEEFSRTLIRGSFQGTLVESGMMTRLGRRERCSPRPGAGTTSGTFIIAAPWLTDDRVEPDASWVEEQAITEIGMFMADMPDPIDDFPIFDDPAADGPAEPTAGGASGGGMGELFEGVECDCSCESAAAAKAKAEALSQDIGSVEDLSNYGLCMMQCAMAWSRCSE